MSAETFYEAELLKAVRPALASGSLQVDHDAAGAFNTLSQRFPTVGSRIDWSRIKPLVSDRVSSPESYLVDALAFAERVVGEQALSGQSTYLSDGDIGFCLHGDLKEMIKYLGPLLETAGHNYLVSKGGNWCIAFSMEGDLDLIRT